MFLTTRTMMFVVSEGFRYLENPTKLYLKLAKRLLRF